MMTPRSASLSRIAFSCSSPMSGFGVLKEGQGLMKEVVACPVFPESPDRFETTKLRKPFRRHGTWLSPSASATLVYQRRFSRSPSIDDGDDATSGRLPRIVELLQFFLAAEKQLSEGKGVSRSTMQTFRWGEARRNPTPNNQLPGPWQSVPRSVVIPFCRPPLCRRCPSTPRICLRRESFSVQPLLLRKSWIFSPSGYTPLHIAPRSCDILPRP